MRLLHASLLLWLFASFPPPARAALEVVAQWVPDSAAAVAAALDAQAFQAGLRRDVAPVYDAAGLPDLGLSAALQAGFSGGTAVPMSTTPAPPPPPPPPESSDGGSGSGAGAGLLIGAAVVGGVAVLGLAAFSVQRGARAAVPPECAPGKALPYRIERPPPEAPSAAPSAPEPPAEPRPHRRAYANILVYTRRGA